jgi:hypothetical protein
MKHGRFLTTYIDLPFLQELFRRKPSDVATSPNDQWPEVWQNVYRFLQISSKIVIDASLDEIADNDPISRYLFASGQTEHVSPRPGMSEEYTDPDCVNVDDPFSLFLFERQDIPVKELRERKGLLFLRTEDLEDHWLRLFTPHAINVSEDVDETFCWGDLRPHAVPLNAIIVADKYLYRQFADRSFSSNLGALLSAMLPERAIDEPLHILIVTDFVEARNSKYTVKAHKVCDQVEQYLKRRHEDLDIRVGTVSFKESGHKDRFIFTNYGVFSSNDSFAFFKDGQLSKETLLTYHPNATHGVNVAEPRLRRIADLCSDPLEYGKKRVYLASGHDRNRLLTMVA